MEESMLKFQDDNDAMRYLLKMAGTTPLIQFIKHIMDIVPESTVHEYGNSTYTISANYHYAHMRTFANNHVVKANVNLQDAKKVMNKVEVLTGSNEIELNKDKSIVDIVCCQRCKSTQIYTRRANFDFKFAVTGFIVAVGTLKYPVASIATVIVVVIVGVLSGRAKINVCRNCGAYWETKN